MFGGTSDDGIRNKIIGVAGAGAERRLTSSDEAETDRVLSVPHDLQFSTRRCSFHCPRVRMPIRLTVIRLRACMRWRRAGNATRTGRLSHHHNASTLSDFRAARHPVGLALCLDDEYLRSNTMSIRNCLRLPELE